VFTSGTVVFYWCVAYGLVMSQTVSAKLDNDQVEHLKQQVDQGRADSISEAVRNEINGENGRTALRGAVMRFGDAFGLVAIIWLGLTFLYPLGFRMFAIPVFVVSVSLYGLDRVLGRYEPAVSNRLLRVTEDTA